MEQLYTTLLNITDMIGDNSQPGRAHLRDSRGRLLRELDEVCRALASGTFMGLYYGARARAARRICSVEAFGWDLEAGAESGRAFLDDGEIWFHWPCGAEYPLDMVLESGDFEIVSGNGGGGYE